VTGHAKTGNVGTWFFQFITLYPNILWQWNFLQLLEIHCASCRKNTLFQYWDVTFRVTGCSLCPLALFSHVRSHIIMCIILCVSVVSIQGGMLPPRQVCWKKEHAAMQLFTPENTSLALFVHQQSPIPEEGRHVRMSHRVCTENQFQKGIS